MIGVNSHIDIEYIDIKNCFPQDFFDSKLSLERNTLPLVNKQSCGMSDERFIFKVEEGDDTCYIVKYLKDILERNFDVSIELSDIQAPTLRILPKGHKGIHIHSDFCKNDGYQEIIAILYLNTIDSGYLEFWQDNGEFFDSVVKITPERNRLVAFRSTSDSLHSVSPVYENRISLNFTFKIIGEK